MIIGYIRKEVIKLKINYIYHSGFTIEEEDYYLIFDYYKGDIELKDKETIIFCSHGHHDHFNSEILNWNNEKTTYVFSDDIDVAEADHIHFMGPYEELTLKGIKIKSFGSTDLGLSFLIEINDKTIFYAGDLNWWYWNSNTDEEKIQEEKDFKDEIAKIKAQNQSIDIAFFPVDPRLEENYYRGGEYMIQELNPEYFFPMHFGDNLPVTSKFANKFKELSTKIMEITKENQVFQIPSS